MRTRFTVSLLCLLLAAAPAVLYARPLGIADMARLLDLEEPAIAPDGSAIAVVAIAQDTDRATYVNSLVLVDARSGALRVVVRGHSVAVPRWSPDGTRLAYLSRPSDSGVAQVYVRDANGRGERVLTRAGNDVIDFAWSPDGRTIAYVAADVPANAAELAHHHDYFFAGDNDYTATALPPSDHLWTVPSRGGTARRLTSGSWTIAPTDPGGIFSPQIAWTPDGTRIAYTRVENVFSGDDENSSLWQIDLRTGVRRKLTGHPRYELSPAYAPDGSRLSYWYPLDGDYNSQNTVRFFNPRGDTAAAPDLDRNAASSIWYPDGRHVLVCATEHTRTLAWSLDLAGRTTALPLGGLNMVCDPYSSATFDAGAAASIARDGTIAFLASDAAHARELYVLRAGAAAPQRLTHYNDFVQSLDLAKMTELQWDGPGGFREYGVLSYPPGFSPAKRHPIVVLIHGGPGLSALRNFVYEQWPLAQAIAARGYLVLQPNYRGSDDAGNAFMHAIYLDSAKGPGEDIMAGLAAAERIPGADPSRVAVCGWSYGGLLTTWLIGHYHDWRAAVSGAAVNDEFEEYNLSTSNVQDAYLLGSSPYAGKGWSVYAEQSPITNYGQITTPTLIWGTTLDPVVPIPQSYSLFHALRDNRVPVQLLVFPASTHGPSNPVQTADLTRLWLAWLDRYLR